MVSGWEAAADWLVASMLSMRNLCRNSHRALPVRRRYDTLGEPSAARSIG